MRKIKKREREKMQGCSPQEVEYVLFLIAQNRERDQKEPCMGKDEMSGWECIKWREDNISKVLTQITVLSFTDRTVRSRTVFYVKADFLRMIPAFDICCNPRAMAKVKFHQNHI